MVIDAFTGETIHREYKYGNSAYNNDIVYDEARDMFFTSAFKHAVGFKVNALELSHEQCFGVNENCIRCNSFCKNAFQVSMFSKKNDIPLILSSTSL